MLCVAKSTALSSPQCQSVDVPQVMVHSLHPLLTNYWSGVSFASTRPVSSCSPYLSSTPSCDFFNNQGTITSSILILMLIHIHTQLLLTGYWMLVSIATGVLVWAQSQEASRFKSTESVITLLCVKVCL